MALDDHNDVADVDAVDGLLDALSRGERPTAADAADGALYDLLLGWRDEVDSTPLPDGPSQHDIDSVFGTDDSEDTQQVASLAVARERREERRRPAAAHHGRNAFLVGAAAVLAVAFGSLSVLAYSAQPGDPLWGVNKTFFNSNAEGIELVSALRGDLDAANQALANGDRDRAAALLESVSARLDGVQSAADRVELIRLRDQIERDINRGAAPEPVPAPAPEPGADPEPQPGVGPVPEPGPQPQPGTDPLATVQPVPTSEAPQPTPTPDPRLPLAPPETPENPAEAPVSPLDPTVMQLRTTQPERDSGDESTGSAPTTQNSGDDTGTNMLGAN